MKSILIAFLILLLAGCTGAKQIQSPNAKKGFFVSCNGIAQSISSCYQRAAKECPSGYNIIDQGSHKNIFGGNAVKKGIFIECK